MNGIVAGNWQTIDLLPDGRTFQSRIHFTPKFSVAVSVVQKNEKKIMKGTYTHSQGN